MPPPRAPPPPPRPAATGGSARDSFHVPPKLGLFWPRVAAGSATTGASTMSNVCLVMSPSSVTGAAGLRHQRLRLVEMRGVRASARPGPPRQARAARAAVLRPPRLRLVDMRGGRAGARLELLRTAAEHFGGVQVAVRVAGELVN